MPAKHLKLLLPLAAGLATGPAQAQSFSEVSRVLRSNCAVCHNAADAQGDLDLSPSVAQANLVNRKASGSVAKLVVPGSPDKSYLLAKLMGTHAKLGGNGVQMPIGSSLRNEDIKLIRDWIAKGAKF